MPDPELIETVERLSLIQDAVNVLSQDMPQEEFDEITGFIEGLCRYSNLPVSAVDLPEALQK